MSEEIQEVTDEGQEPENEEQEQGPGAGSDHRGQEQSSGVDSLPDWAQSLISDLRKENASHRTRAKTAEKEAKAAEEERLAKQEEWKKLAEKRQARIAELEPVGEKVTAYQEAIDGLLEARLKELGDAAKTAVEGLPGELDSLAKLQWLEANVTLFQKKQPPRTDAETRGEQGEVEATQEEVEEFAARIGVDPRFVDPKLLRTKG